MACLEVARQAVSQGATVVDLNQTSTLSMAQKVSITHVCTSRHDNPRDFLTEGQLLVATSYSRALPQCASLWDFACHLHSSSHRAKGCPSHLFSQHFPTEGQGMAVK